MPDDTCTICELADNHSWWGVPGTHCRECHASWRSASQLHCVQCHRQFGSEMALRFHQPFGTECVDPATVATKAGVPKLAPRERENCSIPVWVREVPEGVEWPTRAVSAQSVGVS